MVKSSNNAEVSHLSETCEKLPKSSNQDESSDFSDLQSFLCDDEVYDTNLQSSLKERVVNHGCTRQCINDLLIFLNDLGHSLPKDSRTLLKADEKATSATLFNGEYTYFGVRNTIEKIVTTNNYNDRKVNFMVNIDELLLFKSSSLQLWPILITFSSFKPVPVALYCGYKKPDIGEYLVEFVDEMGKLLSEALEVNVSSYELSIYTFTCDAPARALLKGIVQHTGYYACERCTMKGTIIKGRIVYDRIEESTLRSNDTFMSMGYAEKDQIGKRHQLAPSPIRTLNISMINGFNLDYMHMIFVGVVRRMLYYFKGHFKSVFNGRLSQSNLN